MSNIQIKTEIHGAHVAQEVSDPSLRWWGDERRRLIAREVMNTKDAQVREALIRMGWTPPKDRPEVKPVRMCIIKQTEHEHSVTSYASIQAFQEAREGLILATKAVDPA